MRYNPDDGFDMEQLTDQQAEEALECKRASNQYGFLSLLFVMAAIFMLIKHRWWYAFLTWVLANIASTIATYYLYKAKEVGRE